MVSVNLIFKLLKRRSQSKGELIQKDFMESQAQEVIIKMGIGSPGSKIPSAPIRRIMAMDYLVDVIQNILARADDILDVFKVVRKNSLEDVLFIHKNILQ